MATSVSWVSSRSSLSCEVSVGSGSPSLAAFTITGISAVVSGRVFWRLLPCWVDESVVFLFRVAAKDWLAFPRFLEAPALDVGLESVRSVQESVRLERESEREVAPRVITEYVFFLADSLVVLVESVFFLADSLVFLVESVFFLADSLVF